MELNSRMDSRRTWATVAAAIVVSALPMVAMAAGAGTDPFGTAPETIKNNAGVWGGAMAIVAFLVAGGGLYYGANNAGRIVGRVIAGTIFVLLATMHGDILEWCRGFMGIGQ